MRRHNLSAVLERLHLGGPASRSTLTSDTGLNRSTVADLIGELSELGLVEEGPGSTSAGPGRPSPIVTARADGAIVLAIELSVDSTAAATIGLGGQVLSRFRVARRRGRISPQKAIEEAVALAKPLLSSVPDGRSLVGIGVGIAGVARRSDGFVHLAPNLGWRSVPLGTIMAAELGVDSPLQVANEADLGALVEYRRGSGMGVGHLIYISGEAGIGAGIIYDGRPMLGAAGYAGEAGHMLINPAGHACRCGSLGCWETEAGEEALARHAGIAGSVTGQTIVEEIYERAEAGDQIALDAIAEIGRWLGIGIGNLVNVFNPELVVLGGFYHRLYPFLGDTVEQAVRDSALGAPADVVKIVNSGFGVDAPLYGAAEMAFSALIADPAGVVTRRRLVMASGETAAPV